MKNKTILLYTQLAFAGRSPYAPGTCGSLFAILLAPLLFVPLPLWGQVLFLILIFISGACTATKAEKILQQQDPKSVVIDELFGQWLCLLPFYHLQLMDYALAFLLFRLFDICKPWPIKYFEKLPGGWGIMADDGVAGLFAAISLYLIKNLV